MSGTVPPIPPPLGTNSGNTTSPNRVDPILVDNTNNTPTTNVAQNVINEDLPQLLNSRGGSHVTYVPAFDDNEYDVEEDTRRSSEFLIDLNDEFPDRILLANQKRFYKRSGRIGSAKKPMDKSKVTCFACGKQGVTRVKAFMAIAEDEPYVGKNDARSGAEPIGTSNDVISLVNLTQTSTVSDMTKMVPAKESSVEEHPEQVVVKKTLSKIKAQSSQTFSLRKAPQILKPFIPCKYYHFNDHHSDECEYYPGCDICGSIAHETAAYTKNTSSKNRKPKNANQRSIEPNENGCPRHITWVKQYLHRYSKDSGPKVVFIDNSSGDTYGYGLVNCNGITFTRVAYVNRVKHNLISISQLCDANFKQLFIKTQRTIFNQNNEVVLIDPRRRDVYVIDMSSYNKELKAYEYSRKIENLNDERVKELRSDNGTEVKNHKLEEFYDEKGISQNFSSPLAKSLRVFNIKKQEIEETYHVTFSEDDETISQSSTKGDEINFNENCSFPNDEFLIPRSKTPQSSRKDDYFPCVPAFDPLFTNNITIPNPITPTNQTLIDVSEPQNITISEVESSPTIISPSAEVIHNTLAPQDKWSREKHVQLVNILEIKPEKLVEALEEEG
ncbi:retrovirus-related pol polyprotein from transposon TNT 1-94 [Tanacetum coccineum]